MVVLDRRLFVGRGLIAIDGDGRRRKTAIAQRRASREGHGLNGGERLDALEQRIVESFGALGIVSGASQVDGCEEDALRGETWVECANSLQALHEETCSDQQEKAERHLENNQTRAEPGVSVAAADNTGHFGLQRAGEIDFAGLNRGNQAEQQSRDETNAGAEREHAPIDFAGQSHGNAGARGEKQNEGVTAPVRDEESAGRGESREDEAFGDQLLQEPATVGADCDANGHFMAASERPDEQQIADVGAGNQENKNHYCEHDAEGWKESAGIVEWRLP